MLVLLTLSCGVGPSDSDKAPVSDAELGLSGHTVFEDPVQKPAPENLSEAGESVVRERSFEDAPPVIPHSTDGFEPITAGENLCLDCHDIAMAEDVGATAVPESHYRDLRNAPEVDRDEIAGARYNCTMCHVVQTGAVALVEVVRP